MTHAKRIAVSGLASAAVLMASGVVHAEDLSGPVVRTLILSENSRLVGDVTRQVTGAPCIAFGAANLTLNLNGFAITGLDQAVSTACAWRIQEFVSIPFQHRGVVDVDGDRVRAAVPARS